MVYLTTTYVEGLKKQVAENQKVTAKEESKVSEDSTGASKFATVVVEYTGEGDVTFNKFD